jgi:hypothetical protein
MFLLIVLFTLLKTLEELLKTLFGVFKLILKELEDNFAEPELDSGCSLSITNNHESFRR